MNRVDWRENLYLTFLLALGYWMGSDHDTPDALGFWATAYIVWCLLDAVWSWWRHRNDDWVRR